MTAPPPDPDPLDDLLADCIARFEREGEAALRAMCAATPEHAAFLQKEIGKLRALGMLEHEPAPAATSSDLGDFRLVRRLGAGGSGTVWLAEQKSLKRMVALKVIHAGPGAAADQAERLRLEAETLARLEHPSIVHVIGTGQVRGLVFLATELVEGQGLEDLLAAARRTDCPLRAAEVLTWGRDLAAALDHAHRAGVTHGDVKPGNVRIRTDRRAVLLDFGVARIQGSVPVDAGMTLRYAAPEQCAGRAVDARTDVYSLGLVLHECLTGCLPHAGLSSTSIVDRILSLVPALAPPSLLPLPDDVRTVLAKATDKDPRRRYATAAALAQDLDALLRHEPISARPPGLCRRLRQRANRQPVAAAAVVTLLITLVALGGGFWWHVARERAARRSAARTAIESGQRALALLRASHDALAPLRASAQVLATAVEQRHVQRAEETELERAAAALASGQAARSRAFADGIQAARAAQELGAGNAASRLLLARLHFERWRAAVREGDVALAASCRRIVATLREELPADDAAALDLRGQRVAIRSRPSGARVFLFRIRELRELVPGGEPRRVPVPVGPAVPPVAPGSTTLRVVSGAGGIEPEDQILAVAGQPIHAASADARMLVEQGPPGREILIEILQGGTVRTRPAPPGLRVRATAAPLLVDPRNQVGATPVPATGLEPGEYIALLLHHDHVPLRVPFQLPLDATLDLEVELPAGSAELVGFVPVPGAPDLPAFWIQEREVTVAEYLEFLNDPEIRTAAERAGGAALLPRSLVDGEFRSPFALGSDGLWQRPATMHPDQPITLIGWKDAMRYAAWRSQRATARGTPVRLLLPTVAQWQHAASAPDGRRYAFGQQFRPRWAGSARALRVPALEPVLSRLQDESPLGVFDLTGSVNEWCLGGVDPDRKPFCGGAWNKADPEDFVLQNEQGSPPHLTGVEAGFRLVAVVGQ